MGWFRAAYGNCSLMLQFSTKTSGILFLTLSKKVEKCLCIRFICLSVHALVLIIYFDCLELIYVIQVHYRMFRIGNGVSMTNSSCTERHKIIPLHNSQS